MSLEHTAAVMSGEAGVTLCINCKHMQAIGKSAPEWTWLCSANPKELGFSYLTGKETGEPYRLCKHMNTGGNCPQYEEGINSLSPDRLVPGGFGAMVNPEVNDNGK